MKKKTKIILIIVILLVIIVPACVMFYNNYQYEQDQKNFNNTIKEVSDMENQSDINTQNNIDSNYSVSASAYLNDCENKSKIMDNEINMLQNLSSNTNNKTYEEYISIQIDRLNAEKSVCSSEIDLTHHYEQYKNGEISTSSALSKMKDDDEQISRYVNQTENKKDESQQFLTKHPDLKKTLENLKIDEDFMVNQIEDSNISTVK